MGGSQKTNTKLLSAFIFKKIMPEKIALLIFFRLISLP